MKAATRLPQTVGGAVFAAVLAITFLPSGARDAIADSSGSAGLPDRLADYSYLTGNVSSSPPGRAIATYQHGYGVEFMDFPQAIALAADGDIYRRVDLAESRGGPETQGDAGPSRLSPDGTRTVVGQYVVRAPNLVVLELDTGRRTRHPVPGGSSAVPLAWSPDSTLVAYLTTAEPINQYPRTALRGEIGVLDTETGAARLLPGPVDARAAAFSPDGAQLAIHRIGPDDGSPSDPDALPRQTGGVIDIVDLDGTSDRQVTVPGHLSLDGPAAWSPDGALLAVVVRAGGGGGIAFLDASGADGPVPEPLPSEVTGWHGVLGWTGPREVLVMDGDPSSEDPHDDLYWLTALSLDGGEPRPLSAVPGGGNYGVGDFQVATGLLADLEIRAAGKVDRGPWPGPLRFGTAVVIGGLALVVARIVVQRRDRTRPSAPPASPGQ